MVEATVPANGYAVYDIRLSGSQSLPESTVSQTSLENSVYKITLDAKGDITSLFDKRNNKELVKSGKQIRLALFTENKSYHWPAWEIMKETIDSAPISITEDVKMTTIEEGTLRKTLCVEKRYGQSLFRQYIRLYEGELADRIDFYHEIDWQTSNALLKAEFPLNLDNEKATYDLGIGSIQRGNNVLTAYEVYAQQWDDLTDQNGSYGVSVLNDCKYGWDKPDNNTLRLTLIHTPGTKNNYAYQDHQDIGYHTFTYSLIGHAGELNKTQTVMDAEIAHTGTHRHSAEGDHAYELTYIYKFAIDIPAKATSIILPHNKEIVIFAATLAEEPYAPVKAVSTLFHTANKTNNNSQETDEQKTSLLKPEHITAWSGYVNEKEKPDYLVDGNETTKWCDISMLPNYVIFDLGTEKTISGWKMINAAQESHSYVTSGCFLQGRNNPNEEWRTLDFVTGNKQNVIKRSLNKSEKVRYLRLLITQPVQAANGKDTRIYEFAVYE